VQLKEKLEQIVAALSVPIDVFCSIDSLSIFRKPCTGMWDALHLLRFPSSSSRDLIDRSLYVGDAAGRDKDSTRAKDHSDVDLKLSINLGMAFQTPEHLFLGLTQKLHTQFTSDLTKAIRIADLVKFHPFIIFLASSIKD
jgi:DNA 3'-phosphatase